MPKAKSKIRKRSTKRKKSVRKSKSRRKWNPDGYKASLPDRCFMLKKERKYPVCSKNGKVAMLGLNAAEKRARLVANTGRVNTRSKTKARKVLKIKRIKKSMGKSTRKRKSQKKSKKRKSKDIKKKRKSPKKSKKRKSKAHKMATRIYQDTGELLKEVQHGRINKYINRLVNLIDERAYYYHILLLKWLNTNTNIDIKALRKF